MKKVHFTLLIFVAFTCVFWTKSVRLSTNSDKTPTKRDTITVDSMEREYFVHIPENLPKNSPLVLVFHGYSGSALNTIKTTKFNELADKNGFAVCYPQGLIDQNGKAFWQVGYRFHKDFKVDDVKFTKKLVEKLESLYSLSSSNVFITGFSNGGDFCNLLTCKTEGFFKAAAPIISCFMKEFYDSCQEASPIPTLMLNGTADDITFWEGDLDDKQGYGPYLPTQAMIDFRLKQIKYNSLTHDTIRSSDPKEKTLVSIKKFSNSVSNNRIWMYSYLNGGHGYPDYLKLEEQIWMFFNYYVNPQ